MTLLTYPEILSYQIGDNDDLRRFLCENDYVFYTRLTIDDIYIKKSFLRKLRKL